MGDGISLSTKFFQIRNKCQFLRAAYCTALDKMGDGKSKWISTCCKHAVDVTTLAGLDTATSSRTIANWNVEFRREGKFFHPNPMILNGLRNTPPIFEFFPQAIADINKFMLENLATVNCESLRNEIIDKIIPKLLVSANQNAMVHDSEEYKLLQHYTTKPPSYITVLRWMHHLGYHRGRHQKSYFVDGHEHKEQKAHRKKHTTQYLTVEEPRSHRWVQITVEEHQKLKDEAPEKNPLPETGFKYVDPNTGATMVELHVDDHVSIQKIANEKYGEFGGTTSVRKPDGAKPVIMFGQD